MEEIEPRLKKEIIIGLTGIKGYPRFNQLPEPEIKDPDPMRIQVWYHTTEIKLERKINRRRRDIKNEYFQLAVCQQGVGISVFTSQVKHALEQGIKEIVCDAYGNQSMISKFNGYITWGKFGFQMIEKEQVRFEALMQQLGRSEKYLHELVATEEGLKCWKENGFSWRGRFELAEDSVSMKVLREYLSRKNISGLLL